jgi:anti-anti-sigma factor
VIRRPAISSKHSWKELYLMKRHLTAASAGSTARKRHRVPGGGAKPSPTPVTDDKRTQTDPTERSVALVSVKAWTHTLILTGELNDVSAHALEADIERLCEEGVTGITLDLRKLTYIDSIGVAVIAFRWGHCKRRGYEFAVIPGSPEMHRVLEHAGISDLLSDEQDDVAAPRPPASVLVGRSHGRRGH